MVDQQRRRILCIAYFGKVSDIGVLLNVKAELPYGSKMARLDLAMPRNGVERCPVYAVNFTWINAIQSDFESEVLFKRPGI